MLLNSIQLSLIYSTVFLAGALLIRYSYPKINGFLKYLYAFPFGLSIWVASVLAAIFTKIPPEIIFLFFLAVLVSSHLFSELRSRSLTETGNFLKFTFAFFTGCFLLGLGDFSYFSYDSTELIRLGIHLTEFLKPIELLAIEWPHAPLDPPRSDSLATWGLFVPASHGLALYADSKILYNLQPILSIHVLILGPIFAARLSQIAYKTEIRKLLLSLFVLLLVLNHQFFLQAVYVHNSISASLFLLLTLSLTLELMNEIDTPSPLQIGLLCLVGISFVLHRVEGPLYWTLLLVGLMAVDREELNRFLHPTTIASCTLLVLWYTYIASNGASEHAILSGTILVVFLASLSGLVLFSALKNKFGVHHILKKAFLCSVAVLIIANFAFLILDPAKFHANIYSVSGNLFETYRYKMWGATWVVALIPLVAYGYIGKDPFHRLLLSLFFAFFLVILSMGFFRKPYFVNNFDSSARMLVIFLPLLFSWSLVSFSRLLHIRGAQSTDL